MRGKSEAKGVGRKGDGELTREEKGDCNYPRHCKALVKAKKCLNLKFFGNNLGILRIFFQVIIMVSVPHCAHPLKKKKKKKGLVSEFWKNTIML